NRFGAPEVPQVEVNRIVDAAMDHGINFIDTANTYQNGASEESLGHALKGHLDKVVLATKFFLSKKGWTEYLGRIALPTDASSREKSEAIANGSHRSLLHASLG